MRRQYFIRYGDFSNTFDLAWGDNIGDCAWLGAIGFERCTRKFAEMKARRERDARIYNPAFSGYGSDAVFPAKFYALIDEEKDPWTWLYDKCELKGAIWE